MASVVRALLACALLVGDSACTAAYRISHHARAREQPAAEARFARPDNDQIGSGVVREQHVPRVHCFDGTLSLTCTPERASAADCCPNQGGVYRDRWGNVVAE